MKKYLVGCMETAVGMAIIGLLYLACQTISGGKLPSISLGVDAIIVGILGGTFLVQEVPSLFCKLKKWLNKKK